MTLLTAAVMLSCEVSADTLLYAGEALTTDDSCVFSRSEEKEPDHAKLLMQYPAGSHRVDEEYRGCADFVWTFTHNSFSYTAFCDDNTKGVCPDCGDSHIHQPYQAAGTNEKGVSISAAVPLTGNDGILAEDPYIKKGIGAAEIPTILLGEAETAGEAVQLLTSIYDSQGAREGCGVLIADQKESWYVENTSGTQYLALKLNKDLFFTNPGLSVIGLIDLDDEENVHASENLIETAVDAGTFEGNETENRIDFAASYGGEETPAVDERMKAVLEYFGHEYWDGETWKEVYPLSNLDEEGSIVPLYTGIDIEKLITIQELTGFYRLPAVSGIETIQTHIFQIWSDVILEDSTAMWVSLADSRHSVFVPFYPLLTVNLYPAYTTGHVLKALDEEGSGWEESLYWACMNLGHMASVDDESDKVIAERMESLQNEIFEDYRAEQGAIVMAGSVSDWAATEGSNSMGEKVFHGALALAEELSSQ
ncbi:MAG: C69 family dipeptidase [Blautia sp.]|nr:C69 family dipeptidase [Blautia sp.]